MQEQADPTWDLDAVNASCREVGEWLDLRMKTGRYSMGFVRELAIHNLARIYNVHSIYDEISHLEGDKRYPSRFKTAKPFTKEPLIGLWGKHHFQAVFIMENLKLEISHKKYFQFLIEKHIGKNIPDFAKEFSYDAVISAFTHRSERNGLTGEYIIFEKFDDGSNYYLTLGSHGDDENIIARVKSYKVLDQAIARKR